MNKQHRMLPALLVFIIALGAAATSQTLSDLTVTVSYKGKGKVDATHEIWVFLFDQPNPSPQTRPLATQTVTRNGGSAKFSEVKAEVVYVVLVYDEQASYDGRTGPPPPGTPIGSYSKAGVPIAVKLGTTRKIVASFDDSRRVGK